MPAPDILSVIGRPPKLTVVDVGAMPLGNNRDAYSPLIEAGVATVIGFEPDERGFAKLQANASPGRIFLPYAIGDGTEQQFHICNYPMTSSLLEPDHATVDLFPSLGELMQVERTVPIKTHRLDEVPEIQACDFLKLDVQGAELQVLQSAPRLLSTCLMVQAEVEFIPLYKNQPLFADIDGFMRSHGFVLHRFANLSGRPFKPMRFNAAAGENAYRQLLWGDAIFIRDFRRLDRLRPEELLKFAILAHVICGSSDLALHCLQACDARLLSEMSSAYLDLLRRA